MRHFVEQVTGAGEVAGADEARDDGRVGAGVGGGDGVEELQGSSEVAAADEVGQGFAVGPAWGRGGREGTDGEDCSVG